MAKNSANSITFFARKLGSLMLLGMFLLAVRVMDLQAVRGSLFRHISEQNRQFRLEIPAERGVFLDRFGDPLVINTRRYVRYDNPLALYPTTSPLTNSEALAAQATDPLSVGYSLQRQYVWPQSLSHALGYVSVVNPEDLAANSLLRFTDTVGRIGLEQQYDTRLRGRAGYQEFEINALGQKQAVQVTQPAVPGQNVATTLDPYLSAVAWRAMGSKMGAVVILDAQTGQVLSLVSMPGFNSNLFAVGDLAEDRDRQTALQDALSDERKLFFNRVVSGTYAPGSIFKLVTAVAGLENGAFNVTTTVEDEGVLTVGEQSFANWYYTQFGRTEGEIALVRAIARSNDIFFYRAAEWTGVEKLAASARSFGFGAATGVEIPGERAGLVPDPAWKERTIGERWFLGNTYHMGIGQGDVLVTPLQLARMVAVFGNGGKACPLSVVALENGERPEGCSDLGLAEETLSAVQQGMVEACSAGGTAFPFFPWNEVRKGQLSADLSPREMIHNGVVACKTGTAEFGGTDERGYRRTHAWFGMAVGGLEALVKESAVVGESADANEATPSAVAQSAEVGDMTSGTIIMNEAELDLSSLRAQWLERLNAAQFPREIAVVVLVESDGEQPYMEGSRDAAPVALTIFNWLLGR